MNYGLEFLTFFGKSVIIFLFIAGLIVLIVSIAIRQKMKPEIEVENVNQKIDGLSDAIASMTFEKKELKEREKKQKEENKKDAPKTRIFLFDFEGDLQASAVDELADEITAALTVAESGDEAVIKIESPGGTVHGYGLAAAQLLRLKSAGLKVTACVDRVAASGGYLMACTADQILAAPFAIVGSIGVLAQVPNFHRALKKHDVDFEEISSGEYKRTVSLLGEITEKGRTKFREQISDTHELFKSFVKTERPAVDIATVATGEYWFGSRALALKLVDKIMTSDEYLFGRRKDARIFHIKVHAKKKFSEKLADIFGTLSARAVDRALERILSNKII